MHYIITNIVHISNKLTQADVSSVALMIIRHCQIAALTTRTAACRRGQPGTVERGLGLLPPCLAAYSGANHATDKFCLVIAMSVATCVTRVTAA